VSGVSILPVQASITFACAPNIDSALAGTCNYLNTTIAGFYNSKFNDVNAQIYIQYGTTGLGSSLTALDGFSYTTVRNALNADRTSANDTTFFNNDVPASNPFATGNVALTHANSRALGLAAGNNGVTAAGGNCTGINGTTCFDSVITLSDAARIANHFWYRSLSGGAQGANQYDFFSVVFHETDEVLGTMSLCCGEIAGFFAPSDLGRYASSGVRSHGFGGNAFFSINAGGTMIVQYNNLNNGADTGDYATTCTYVQDAFGCAGPGLVNHDPTNGVELTILDVVGYTQAAPEPATVSLLAGGLGIVTWLSRRRRTTRIDR
jgi:hypothetical protein